MQDKKIQYNSQQCQGLFGQCLAIDILQIILMKLKVIMSYTLSAKLNPLFGTLSLLLNSN